MADTVAFYLDHYLFVRPLQKLLESFGDFKLLFAPGRHVLASSSTLAPIVSSRAGIDHGMVGAMDSPVSGRRGAGPDYRTAGIHIGSLEFSPDRAPLASGNIKASQSKLNSARPDSAMSNFSIRSSEIDELVEESIKEFIDTDGFTAEQIAFNEATATALLSTSESLVGVNIPIPDAEAPDGQSGITEEVSGSLEDGSVDSKMVVSIASETDSSVPEVKRTEGLVELSDPHNLEERDDLTLKELPRQEEVAAELTKAAASLPPPPPLRFRVPGQAALMRKRAKLLNSFPREVLDSVAGKARSRESFHEGVILNSIIACQCLLSCDVTVRLIMLFVCNFLKQFCLCGQLWTESLGLVRRLHTATGG